MFRSKSQFNRALILLVGVATLLVGLWIYVGVRFGVWTYNDFDRYSYLTENLPVAHALWHNKIKVGDNAEQIISLWHPHMIWRFGRWVEMTWYPGGPKKDVIPLIGITVRAEDGVLIYASSYSDDGIMERIFFNNLTLSNELEYRGALRAYTDGLKAEHAKGTPH